MKKVIITVLAILPIISNAHDELPIFQEWENLKSDVHKHLFNKNYDQAIESSKRLLAIDPSNDEAKFHLVFSYVQSGKELPQWIQKEIRFTNTDTGSFYEAVFTKLNKAN